VSESVLETKRLLIRDLRMDDLDDLATLFGDPETMRFYPRPDRRDEVRAMIDRNLARWREGIATEAATAVRDHAFGDLGLRRLIALVRPDNEASQGGWPGSSGWRSNVRQYSTTFPI
jgi:RimJ/RimL family protein N-acetyltransferase